MMRVSNGWRYLYKDRNRINVEIRVGKLTLFRFYADFSDRQAHLTFCNVRVGVW